MIGIWGDESDTLSAMNLSDLPRTLATDMPHIIAQPCIATKDASCTDVCPVDCIHPTKNEPEFATAKQLYIDPDTCIDCGLCVEQCPVKAIYPEEDLPGEWTQFVQLNKDFYDPKAKGG